MENSKYITVLDEEYEQLRKDSYFLNCLRAAGVDNWEWYGDAVEEYNKKYSDGD